MRHVCVGGRYRHDPCCNLGKPALSSIRESNNIWALMMSSSIQQPVRRPFSDLEVMLMAPICATICRSSISALLFRIMVSVLWYLCHMKLALKGLISCVVSMSSRIWEVGVADIRSLFVFICMELLGH